MPLIWLNTAGGPLVLLGAGSWAGTTGSGVSSSCSDYDLACQTPGYCGRVEPLPDTCLVLGDEPLQSTLIAGNGAPVIVRWVACQDAETAEAALRALPFACPAVETPHLLEVSSQAVRLIDAATDDSDGAGVGLSAPVAPGVYSVTTEKYVQEGRFEFLIHRLGLRGPN